MKKMNNTDSKNRDKLIIAYRYGIKDGKCYTLVQVSKVFGNK